jgi:hypothetical protein
MKAECGYDISVGCAALVVAGAVARDGGRAR